MPEYTARFLNYHSENPHVWDWFVQFTMQAIKAGRGHFSAKAVFERLRWHARFETKGDEFKINNNYTADYARKFMNEYPQYNDLFETRIRKANDVIDA
jgi:hypothetical protein